MHARPELCPDLRRIDALMIGNRSADKVSGKLAPHAVRRMSLNERAPLQPFINYGMHPLTVIDHTDVVHDLGDADNVIHVKQLAYLFRQKRRPRIFHTGNGGNAGWRQNILAEL